MHVGKEHETAPQICPHCGYTADRAAGIETDSEPSPGDIALCIECGEWSAYAEDLSLRLCTVEEIFKASSLPEFRAARDAWVKMKAD